MTRLKKNEQQLLLKRFGYKLAVLRAREHMSVRFLAAMTRVDPKEIYKYERGLVNPSLVTIASLAYALNVEPRELLIFEDPQAYKQLHRNQKK
ncbi:MAG: helix-turn-helix transcriptional regulator [Bacteroidota bacterium]